jgi:lysophospholipase L1-like esterase
VRKIAEERGLTYIDLYDQYAVDGELPDAMSYDGLHLTNEAYSTWYNELKSIVE